MKKRILSLAISAALVLTMLPAGALAAGDKGTPPVYNKATGCYEISTLDQLLYLSGSWKDGAPRDGHYVLTADIDMSGVKGFKPIASKKDKGFIGTFDGQFHAIKGLRVEYEKKYAGLFGYVGNQDDQAYIKDVALLDCYVTGQQNVGALAGVNYGTITGCVVTGEVKCLDLSNSHTAGGICGKLKRAKARSSVMLRTAISTQTFPLRMMRAALPAFRTAAAIWHAALQPVRSIPPQRAAR